MKCHPANTFRLCILAGLLFGGFSPAAVWQSLAQGVFQPIAVLRTGEGGPLVTGAQNFFLPASPSTQTIDIAVGFATDEAAAPGTFLDSLTLTIEDPLGVAGAVFFTFDATGALWAPPGGMPVDPDSILRQAISFPEIPGQVPADRVAYYLTLPLPSEMSGRQLTLYLDLFDNGDSLPSLGWMGPVAVIPEPSTLGLVAFAGAAIMLGWRRQE